nr:hypothetical protein [Tanacetum cinerariifolium]
MEGGVFDDERISVGSNKRGREDKNSKIGRLEKKPSGMVITQEYSGDEMINGVKYEEEKDSLSPSPTPKPNSGGGLFNQLINNLVSPRASEPHDHVFEPESDKNGGENSNGGDEVVDKDGGAEVVDNIVAKLPTTLSEDTVSASAPPADEASILLNNIKQRLRGFMNLALSVKYAVLLKQRGVVRRAYASFGSCDLLFAERLVLFGLDLEGLSYLQNNMNDKLNVIHRDIKSALSRTTRDRDDPRLVEARAKMAGMHFPLERNKIQRSTLPTHQMISYSPLCIPPRLCSISSDFRGHQQFSQINVAGNGGDDEVVDKDGGAEVVDNIVAKLPTTLSEDKVPASAPPADEASILLHSIIHD